MTFTTDQAEAYACDGVVRLSGLIPAPDIEAMRAAVWRKLEARSGAASRPSKLTARDGEFDAMATPAIRGLLDDLLGDWDEPTRWGLPLVAFHTGQAAWDVPHENWHIDLGGRPGDYALARFFVILEPSRPGGGGTGCVAGSHRLFAAIAEREGRFRSSGEARRRLIAARDNNLFRALAERGRTDAQRQKSGGKRQHFHVNTSSQGRA